MPGIDRDLIDRARRAHVGLCSRGGSARSPRTVENLIAKANRQALPEAQRGKACVTKATRDAARAAGVTLCTTGNIPRTEAAIVRMVARVRAGKPAPNGTDCALRDVPEEPLPPLPVRQPTRPPRPPVPQEPLPPIPAAAVPDGSSPRHGIKRRLNETPRENSNAAARPAKRVHPGVPVTTAEKRRKVRRVAELTRRRRELARGKPGWRPPNFHPSLPRTKPTPAKPTIAASRVPPPIAPKPVLPKPPAQRTSPRTKPPAPPHAPPAPGLPLPSDEDNWDTDSGTTDDDEKVHAEAERAKAFFQDALAGPDPDAGRDSRGRKPMVKLVDDANPGVPDVKRPSPEEMRVYILGKEVGKVLGELSAHEAGFERGLHSAICSAMSTKDTCKYRVVPGELQRRSCTWRSKEGVCAAMPALEIAKAKTGFAADDDDTGSRVDAPTFANFQEELANLDALEEEAADAYEAAYDERRRDLKARLEQLREEREEAQEDVETSAQERVRLMDKLRVVMRNQSSVVTRRIIEATSALTPEDKEVLISELLDYGRKSCLIDTREHVYRIVRNDKTSYAAQDRALARLLAEQQTAGCLTADDIETFTELVRDVREAREEKGLVPPDEDDEEEADAASAASNSGKPQLDETEEERVARLAEETCDIAQAMAIGFTKEIRTKGMSEERLEAVRVFFQDNSECFTDEQWEFASDLFGV